MACDFKAVFDEANFKHRNLDLELPEGGLVDSLLDAGIEIRGKTLRGVNLPVGSA